MLQDWGIVAMLPFDPSLSSMDDRSWYAGTLIQQGGLLEKPCLMTEHPLGPVCHGRVGSVSKPGGRMSCPSPLSSYPFVFNLIKKIVGGGRGGYCKKLGR